MSSTLAGYCFGAPFAMECIAQDWVTAGRLAQFRELSKAIG